jgi:lipoprotein-anchoring transpeptidase ErfK/SrfK
MFNKKAKHSVAGRSSAAVPILICGVVALALGAGGFVLASARHPGSDLSRPRLASATTSSTVPGPTHPPAPLRVVGITPRDGARPVSFGTDVTISFSVPVAKDGVLPELKPAPPGHWSWATPDKLVFRPNGNFLPFTRVRLTLPGGPGGFSSKQGMRLPSTVKSSFAGGAPSTLRLQQLLAELGYLPVSFVPSSAGGPGGPAKQARLTSADAGSSSPGGRVRSVLPPGPPSAGATPLEPAPAPRLTTVYEPASASAIPLKAVPGTFSWRYGNTPAPLTALWSPGKNNTITTGALMQFELASGLPTDGQAGPKVWAALLRAVAHRWINRSAYDYVMVSTGSPEYVSLWRDGEVIYKTLANTGIPAAPTALGTYPVYARYVTTTMSGTNPNGTPYDDPGIPWVSYFNGGDALHGFLRASYGFPQSLGCVEMPYSSAHTVFPFTPIGTLVSVL